jgi:hypothetical protein
MRTKSHHNVTLCVVLLAGCGSVTSGNSKSGEPTIDSVSPDHGSVVGGTMVTLTGKNFSSNGTPIVVVGGHQATNVVVTSSNEVTFDAPAGDQEGATVDVTFSSGGGFGTLPQSYTFNYQPVVLMISPPVGKSTGGTNVTITGRNFTADSGMPTIMLGGGAATNVQIVDDKTITATTGAAAAGTPAFTPLDVALTTANGTATLPNAFAISRQGLIAIGPTPPRCCSAAAVTYIDPVLGTVKPLSTMGIHAHACALSPTGELYVVGMPVTQRTAARQLYTLDPLTGNTTLVGPLVDGGNVQHNIGSLTFDGNTLYGIDSGQLGGANSRTLAAIDPNSGRVSLIGAAMTVGVDNAIAAKDAATLYVADATNTSLDTIAVATGVRTAGLAFAGGNPDRVHGLVNTSGGIYLASTFQKALYTVNLGGSAALTSFASVAAQSPQTITGLCQTPPSF